MLNYGGGELIIDIYNMVLNYSPALSSKNQGGAKSSGTIYESEPNDSYSTADVTYDDYDNYGAISYGEGVDWWTVTFPVSGSVNFWLGNIPGGTDYDLFLYASNGTTQLGYSIGTGSSELITYAVIANTAYYIKVESFTGWSDSLYWLRAKIYPDFDGVKCKIQNVGSSKYMNVDNGYDYNEMNVYQYTDSDTYFAQEFRIVYDREEGAYRILPICSKNGKHRVLDVVKAGEGVPGLVSGCNLEIYSPVDNIAQLFLIESVGSGQYKIILKYNTSLAITAYGSSNGTSGGTTSTSAGNLFVATYSATNNQKWYIESSDLNHEDYYADMGILYPFRGGTLPVTITSGFGYRIHPLTGEPDGHGGIDISASSQTLLYSVFDGKVIVVEYDPPRSQGGFGRGWYIIVEATDSANTAYNSSQLLRYEYMHMYESPTITNNSIVEDENVTSNTLVGKIGTTGDSTNNHLHYSIIIDGGTSAGITHAVDPMMFYPDTEFTFYAY